MQNRGKTIFFTVVMAFLLSAMVFADNRGTDFWIVFPQNHTGPSACVPTLYIYSDFAVYGTITAYALALPVNFNVSAGSYATVPLSYVTAAYGNDAVTSTGIHIEASDQVTVYGLSKNDVTADGFLALPTASLGTRYIVLAYSGRFMDMIWMSSQMAVAATEDNTTVHIDCPVNPGIRPAPYDITLNKGQAYQLMDAASPVKDLTGTIITSDKPVAVFGGHRCAKVPEAYMAADYMVEQLPPVNSWGFECFSMPLMGRAGGDTFRVVAAEDGTSLTVNATPVALLNAGQGVEFISGLPNHIKADKPILAAQYANGMEYDNNSGDPFMMLLTHPEQFVYDSTIIVPGGYTGNYVNIVCADAFAGTIVFDGVNIPAGSYVSIDGSGYSGTRRSVSAGKHVITSPNKFGIWVYGFKDYESFGFQGGAGALFFTPTVTPTISPTHSISPTFSVTVTFSCTPSFTPSSTVTDTRTPTFTRTASPTYTGTRTASPTRTLTLTRTPTLNPSASTTETPSITPSVSDTPTLTMTQTTSFTFTATETRTESPTATATYTDTPVFTPSDTPVVSPSNTVTNTFTGSPTFTYSVTPSLSYTLTVTPTHTATFTLTMTLTATNTPTATASPAATETPVSVPGPLELILKGNYPDPVSTHTEIVYWLSKDAEVWVKIFTVSGEIVFESSGQPGKAGNNTFGWSMVNKRFRQAGSGVYLYRIRAKSADETVQAMRKMAIVR